MLVNESSSKTKTTNMKSNIIQNLDFVYEYQKQNEQNIVPQYVVKHEKSSSLSSSGLSVSSKAKAITATTSTVVKKLKHLLRNIHTSHRQGRNQQQCRQRQEQNNNERPNLSVPCSNSSSSSTICGGSKVSMIHSEKKTSLTSCSDDQSMVSNDHLLTTKMYLTPHNRYGNVQEEELEHINNHNPNEDVEEYLVIGKAANDKTKDSSEQLLELSERYYALGQIYQYKLCIPQQALQYYYQSYYIAIQCFNKVATQTTPKHTITSSDIPQVEEICGQIQDAKQCIGRIHFELGNIEEAMRML